MRNDEPKVSSNAVICEFSTGLNAAKVILDSEAGMVHFGNCHTPRKFLARTSEWYSCRISDLKGVYLFCLNGELLTVATDSGRANIPYRATHYQEIRQYLMEAAPANQPEFATDNPVMPMVYVGGGLIGVGVGVVLTALLMPHSSEMWLGLFFLIGAVGGVLASHGIVDLAQPIGYGMVGAGSGLSLVGGLGPFIGWAVTPVIVAVLFGAVGGVVFGCSINRKQQRKSETSGRGDSPNGPVEFDGGE